jgi:tRNA-binding EMAP/Myf-like protein
MVGRIYRYQGGQRRILRKDDHVGSNIETRRAFSAGIVTIVVGKNRRVETHPDADNLSFAQIGVGEEDLIQIVTVQTISWKAPTFGHLHAERFPTGGLIKKEMRGLESNGMMCSPKKRDLKTSSTGRMRDGIRILERHNPPDGY